MGRKPKSIEDQLRDLVRQQKPMRAVGAAAGIRPETLCNWLAGREPIGRESLVRLAAVLKCDLVVRE